MRRRHCCDGGLGNRLQLRAVGGRLPRTVKTLLLAVSFIGSRTLFNRVRVALLSSGSCLVAALPCMGDNHALSSLALSSIRGSWGGAFGSALLGIRRRPSGVSPRSGRSEARSDCHSELDAQGPAAGATRVAFSRTPSLRVPRRSGGALEIGFVGKSRRQGFQSSPRSGAAAPTSGRASERPSLRTPGRPDPPIDLERTAAGAARQRARKSGVPGRWPW